MIRLMIRKVRRDHCPIPKSQIRVMIAERADAALVTMDYTSGNIQIGLPSIIGNLPKERNPQLRPAEAPAPRPTHLFSLMFFSLSLLYPS
jgi:hypothetical protein